MISARIKKEFRMILPEWITALVLATCPLSLFLVGPVLLGQNIEFGTMTVTGLFGIIFGCAWLSTAIFGKEHRLGTMEPLMALPTTRRKLWIDKGSAALITVGSTIIAYLISVTVVYHWTLSGTPFSITNDHRDLLPYVFICALGPGLLFSIYLRCFHEAFLLTLLTPLAILLSIASLAERVPALVQNNAPGYMIAFYGLGALFLAWKATLGWQATRLQNRSVFFSLPQLFSPARTQSSSQIKSPLHWTLIKKEIRIHQFSFVMTAIFGSLYAWWIYSVPEGVGREILSSEMMMNLRASWLLIPAAIGAAAIAEERSMGVTAWHHSLPATRRICFTIKLGVALVLSFLLGTLAPLPLDYWLQSVTVPLSINQPENLPSSLAIGLITWACPVLVTLLAFYASSLSSSLLQAFLVTALLSIGLIFHFITASSVVQSHALINPTLFIALITTVVLVPVLLYRAYQNIVAYQTTRSKIAQIVATWAIASAVIIATCVCVFSRFWEAYLPLPSIIHRSANASTKPQFLSSSRTEIQLLTNDGKLRALLLPSHSMFDDEDRSHLIAIDTEESWQSIAQTKHNRIGIRTDGSLWQSTTSLPTVEQPNVNTADHQTKIESEVLWSSILSTRRHYDGINVYEFFALKVDGSLHRASEIAPAPLEAFSEVRLPQPLKEIHATSHYLLGLTQSGGLALLGQDPKHLLQAPHSSSAARPFSPKDLDLQLNSLHDSTDWDSIHIIANAIWLSTEGFFPKHLSEEPGIRSRQTFPIAIFKKTNGSFWTFAWTAHVAYGQDMGARPPYQMVEIQQDPWHTYTREWSYNYTQLRRFILKTDGTLWRSRHKDSFGDRDYFNFLADEDLTPLGNRDDWEVIKQHYDGTYFGITSNDILWTWGAPAPKSGKKEDEPYRLIPHRQLPRPIFDLRTGQAIGN